MKTITLALQGGGSHGAFTWGALDRLLADERLTVEAISATSAGAINGALAASGYATGGRDGARRALAGFWDGLAEAARFSPLRPTLADRLTSRWGLTYSPVYQLAEALLRLFSPYQINPFDLDPLRDLIEISVDFDRLRHHPAIALFVGATNVRSGKLKIFRPPEIDADVIMASACLPQLHKAVEIAGEAYWDGGYMANPALFPLLRWCTATELVIIQVSPLAGPVPTSAQGILDRINEISFNSSVIHEMQSMAFITRLLDQGQVDPAAGLRKRHVHMIHDPAVLTDLPPSSKFNTEAAFLAHLFQAGHHAAEDWLVTHWDDLGQRSTVDLRGFYS